MSDPSPTFHHQDPMEEKLIRFFVQLVKRSSDIEGVVGSLFGLLSRGGFDVRAEAKKQLSLAKTLALEGDDFYELYRRAFECYERNEFRQAVQICSWIESVAPGFSAVEVLMAVCHLELWEVEEALAILNKVLEQDDTDLEAHRRKAEALIHLGRFEEADSVLENLEMLDPEAESEDAQLGLEIRTSLREFFRSDR